MPPGHFRRKRTRMFAPRNSPLFLGVRPLPIPPAFPLYSRCLILFAGTCKCFWLSPKRCTKLSQNSRFILPTAILSLACFPTSCPGQTCAQSPGCAVRLRHTEEPGSQFQAQRHQERGDCVLAAALCCAVGCVPSHSSAGAH
jgi:hypothetical protein